MENRHINIVGGGIAGMTLALTAQQLGLDYSLYEKNNHLGYSDVGLGISANIFPILKHLNVMDSTNNIGARIEKFHFVNKRGKYLGTFPLRHPALSVRRKEFYHIISDKIEKNKIHLNQAVQSSDFDPSDIVVYANGLDAQIRKELYPSLKQRDSKQVLWRGISKIQLPEKYQHAYHDFIGKNLRFAIIHTGSDYYSWYIVRESSDIQTREHSKSYLHRLLQGYPEIAHDIIDTTNDIFFSRLIDINPRKRRNLSWYKGNSVLIGDSIHPTTPNMANGACLSMEDGFLLGNLLATSESVEHAYSNFQKSREKKVNQVVNQSWFLGKSMHWNHQTLTWLTEQAIRATPKFVFDKIYSSVTDEGELLPKIYEQH